MTADRSSLSGPDRSGAARPPRRGAGGWLDAAPVTRGLLALNVAVFAMEAALARSLSDLPQRLALELGASYALATVGERRWETLITACFLHAGVLHLAFNMLALWQAGPLVERTVGSARMAPMYLAAGAFGNLLSVAWGWSAAFRQLHRRRVGGDLRGDRRGARRRVAHGRLARPAHPGDGPVARVRRRLRRPVELQRRSASTTRRTSAEPSPGRASRASGGAARTTRRRPAAPWSPPAPRSSSRASPSSRCATGPTPSPRWPLQDRADFASDAAAEGRCGDAQTGLRAVERLRAKMAPVTSLRHRVEAACGHDETR